MPDPTRFFPDEDDPLPRPAAPIGLDRTRPDPGRFFPENEPDPLRQLIGNAAKTTPDTAAKVFNLRLKTGLTPSVIERNLDQVERATARADFDPVRFREANPHLSRWILDDPSRASLVQDDLESLSGLERALQIGARSVRALATGPLAAATGLFGGLRATSELFGDESKAAFYEDMASVTEHLRRQLAGDRTGAGFVEGAVYGGLESLSLTATAIPAAIAGGPLALVGVLGGVTAGQAYSQARETREGGASALFAGWQGLVEAATELIPAKWIVKDLASNASFRQILAHQMKPELVGEQIATALQDLGEWVGLRPDATLMDYLRERPSAAAETLIATVVAVGGQSALVRGLERASGTSASEQIVDGLHKATEAVKIRESAPEALHDFIAQNDLKHVYADTKAVVELYQSKGQDPAQAIAKLTGDPEAFQLAMESGDIAIPTANYLTQVVGSGDEAFWVKEIRVDLNGPNGRETQAELAQEAETPEPSPGEDVASRQHEQATLKAELSSRIMATGRASQIEAESVAAWAAEFFPTAADRAGLDMGALVERWLPQVQAGEPGVQAVNELRQTYTVDSASIPEYPGRELSDHVSPIQTVPMELIEPSEAVDPAVVETMRAAMEAGEALPAIVVEFAGETETGADRLTVVDGHTRLAAAQALGLREIPVRVRVADDDWSRVKAAGGFTVNLGAPPPLPGAESVRDQNIQTPQFEAPFSLTPEISTGTRGRQDTLFQRAAQTLTPAFQAWFGESKVVDEAGAPLVVHHGTPLRKPTVISPKRAIETPGVVFLSSNEEVASTFTLPREYGEVVFEDERGREIKPGDVVPLFVKMENPLILEGEDAQRATDDTAYQGEVVRRAKAEGHDGVIFRGVLEGIGETYRGDTYGVFNARQIKSAKRNRGTFDPNDPNILHQTARGSIVGLDSGQSPIIKLFRAKNRSTLFHEFSHLFLGMYSDIANQLAAGDLAALTEVQRGILGDQAILREWLADEDHKGQGWSEQQQEQFARGFEAYVMEGKSPSLALRGVFARAASWLRRIYQSVAGISREAGFTVELTDEVRGVMARMLASDAAIAEAEQDAGVQALFTTAEQAQVPETEFAGYVDLLTTAHDARVSQLQTRVMKDLLREDQEWWKTEKAAVRAEVTAEVHAQPVYRALSAIRKGTKPDGSPLIEGEVTAPMKLSKAALVEQFGPDILARLPRPYVYTPGRGGPQAGPELRDRAGEQPLAEAERSTEGAGDGRGAERRRLPAPGDYPLEAFAPASQKADRARLTPAVTNELTRIADELRELPYVANSWHWLDPREKNTGNAAGGQADIIEGTAGAPVFDDILQFSPLNKGVKGEPIAKMVRGTRSQVEAAIRKALETRRISSNLAEGALRVAERREAQDYRYLSRPQLPPTWGEEVSREFTDDLSEAHDDATFGDVSFDVEAIEAEGLSPDLVAGFFGFEDGSALVTAIIAAPPMNRSIVEQTDARMRERHGDMLTNPVALAEQAQQAIAEDHRDTVIRAEFAMLRKLEAATAPVKAEAKARTREGARRLRTELPDAATLKRGAAEQIASMRLRDIRPDRFFAAARRASRLATQAAAKQKFDEAIPAKRTELINLALYREALAVRDAVEQARTDFAKMFGSDKTLAKRRAMDYVHAARAIAATYFWPERRLETAREALDLVKRDNPDLWLVLDRDISETLAAGTDLQGLTGAQFEAMRSTVDALWETSLRSRQQLINGQLVELAEGRAALTARMDQVAPPQKPRGWAVTGVLGLKNAFTIMGHWVSFMDANDPTGVFRRYVLNPAEDAKAQYLTARADVIKRYLEALKPIKPLLRSGEIHAPELGPDGYTFKDFGAFVHALGHTGNESNFGRLIVRRGWGTVLDDGTISAPTWDAFLARMQKEGKYTEQVMDFVQAQWHLTESLKPGAQRSMVEQYGRRFREITAWPVVTPWKTYQGGYLPAVPDPFESATGNATANLDAIENVHPNIFPEPGFAKSRVETYEGPPLALDLALIPNHLDKVLRFTFLQPRAKEIERLLIKDKTMHDRLFAYDPSLVPDLIQPWLERLVSQKIYKSSNTPAFRMMDLVFLKLRSRSAMTALAGSIVNAAQNVAGVLPAIVKLKNSGVKASYLKNALWAYLAHPIEISEAHNAESPFMRNTGSGQVAEEQRVIDDLLLHPNKYQQIEVFAQTHSYVFQIFTQNIVSRLVYQAGKDAALADLHLSPADAIRFGETLVKETQSSGQPEDIAAVQVRAPFARIFMPFFGWANMMANLNGYQQAATYRDMGLRKGAGRMLYTWFFAYMAVATVGEIIRQSLIGWDDDDDDTHIDEILWLFFGSQARLAASFIPGGLLQAASNYYFTSTTYDDRVMSSPAIAQIESTIRLPGELYRAMAEDGPKKAAVRDTLSLIGLLSGVPVGPVIRPAGYLADVLDEREEPENATELVRGLVSGRSQAR